MWFQVIVLAIRNHRIVMTQVHSILIAVSSELPAWWCFSLQKISEYAFFFFFPFVKIPLVMIQGLGSAALGQLDT